LAKLWVEVDAQGRLLRCPPELTARWSALEPPVVDLVGVSQNRSDLRAALARGAGRVRIGIGRPGARLVYDVDVGPGSRGLRLELREVDPGLDPAELGGILRGHAEEDAAAWLVLDPDGVVLWHDPQLGELLGYDDLVGQVYASLRSPRATLVDAAAWDLALATGGPRTGETLLRHAEGTDVPIRYALSTRTDEDGRVTHRVVALHDLTQARELERVRAVDRSVLLVGRLMGAYAGRVQGLAGELVGITEQAMLSDDPASAGDALARAEALGAQLTEVSRQMSSLAAVSGGPGPAELGVVARDLGELLGLAAAWRVPVRVALPPEPVWVAVPPDALVRASVHLALRALDGGPDGPAELQVGRDGDSGYLRLSYRPGPSERAALRRLAPGTAPPELNGLVARAYAQGLALRVSEEDDGRVAVELRARLAARQGRPGGHASAAEGPHGARAVVVEDPAAGGEAAQALEGVFGEVRAYSDAPSAWGALMALDGAADLLLIDLQRASPAGQDLLAAALARWPRLRVVVVSGAESEGVVQSAREGGVRAILRAPFRVEELRALVRSVMADAAW